MSGRRRGKDSGKTSQAKHGRRDAERTLKLLAEKRFPVIWMPSKEQLDLLSRFPFSGRRSQRLLLRQLSGRRST